MFGSILGDIVGSRFEWKPNKTESFNMFDDSCINKQYRSHFTDDSVMSCGTAKASLENKTYQECYIELGRKYPNAGYGGSFKKWLHSANPTPYNSFGNGSGMRVAPVGWMFSTMEETLREAEKSAKCSHDHPEGIKGAQGVAAAIFMARTDSSKSEIAKFIEDKFEYDLSRDLDDIRLTYKFDVTCQGSVPESIIAFLESTDLESAIRKAISLGGDSDTQACMAGAIAEAFYKEIPLYMYQEMKKRLAPDLLDIAVAFHSKYCKEVAIK